MKGQSNWIVHLLFSGFIINHSMTVNRLHMAIISKFIDFEKFSVYSSGISFMRR